MKNKKGFTLIELLAIIVILAIIAVITVPVILGIIDNAKKGAAVDSAYGYKDSINKYFVSTFSTNDEFNLDGTFTVEDGELGDIEIPLSGKKPSSGYLTYEKTELVSGCLVVDGYKIEYIDGEFKSTGLGECDVDVVDEPKSCIKVTYDVNMEACKGMFTGSGASEEEATNVCNGTGTFMGYTRDNIFIGSTGNDNDIDSNTVDGAVSRGYISNVKYEKTCDSCFIYADSPVVEVESFNFNCAGYLNMMGITDPDIVDGFCNNGGEFSGITYDDLYSELESQIGSMSKENIDEFVSMGLISDVVYNDDALQIKRFLCYQGNPFGLAEYTSASDFSIPNTIGSKKITMIGEKAFINSGLSGVLDLQSNTNLKLILDQAFYGNNLVGVKLPSNLKSIGYSAFINNQISSITFSGATNVDSYAFKNNNLTSITIPDGVTRISPGAFSYNNLTSVEIPNSVTEIGQEAFENNQLTSVIIPNSVTRIYNSAFGNNPNLTINVVGYASKPSGWEINWNINNYPVNWNYQG